MISSYIFLLFDENVVIGASSVMNALISILYEVGEIFIDKTVEKRSQDELFKIPAVDGAAYLVGYFPNGSL